MPARDLGREWLGAMRRGDFATAWLIADDAIACERESGSPDLPRWLQRVWDGQPLGGKEVLVRCWRGLGDTLQFSRFLPDLAAVCRHVVVAAQPELAPLVQRIAPMVELVPPDAAPPHDSAVEITELAHILRVTAPDVAARVPYLRVPQAPRPGSAFNVGIVAEAGQWDRRRSIPPALLEPLGQVPGCAFFSLRPGSCLPWARDLSAEDVLAVAASVRSLDLVLTVDTFMAHLAGAMDVPAWTMLHADPDWRWLRAGPTTPWYPGMRLFRQRDPGDWEPLLQDIQAELALAAARQHRPPPRTVETSGA